ncbi:MAG: LPS-assembly protein LptD, partial [Magnetospirillum sp.]
MSRSRPLLLLTILASSTALAGFAHADPVAGDAFPEVGGWGQAWGDDAVSPPPSAASVRRPPPAVAPGYVPPPPAAALPFTVPVAVRPTVAAQAPAMVEGEAYPEVGGWGQAWGEDEAVPALRPRSSATSTTAIAPSAAAAAPRPAAARPVSSRPSSADAVGVPIGRARSMVVSIVPEDIERDGDAVGMKKPPRLIPKSVLRQNRRDEGEDPPVRMVADQITYDREYGIVTAKGRVEMIQSDRTLSADAVTYNLKQDVMGASGNVVMTEPTGEVTFADYFELTGDFKNGVASEIRMILADNSRLAAQAGQRVGGDRTDFDRVVYTACEPCRDDPEATPIWQAKAARVTHNQAEAQIEYRDAWIELAGVPVLYTPYMSHPDPTVK